MEIPLDAVHDNASHLLETKQRMLAISECRNRLDCDFHTALEVIRLIERKTPRADITEAMEKAASGEEGTWYCLINEKKVGPCGAREMKKWP